MNTKSAPRAIDLRMSVPLRIPPCMKIYTSAKPSVFKSFEILYNIEIGEGDDVSDSFSVIQIAYAPSLAALKASFEFNIP